MDNVHMPFETLLNYSSFAIRVSEAEVEHLDDILRSVTVDTRRTMRRAMRHVWTRFTYSRSFLDVNGYLPSHSTRTLPHSPLEDDTIARMKQLDDRGAPDAFDTIMLWLATRLDAQ